MLQKYPRVKKDAFTIVKKTFTKLPSKIDAFETFQLTSVKQHNDNNSCIW